MDKTEAKPCMILYVKNTGKDIYELSIYSYKDKIIYDTILHEDAYMSGYKYLKEGELVAVEFIQNYNIIYKIYRCDRLHDTYVLHDNPVYHDTRFSKLLDDKPMYVDSTDVYLNKVTSVNVSENNLVTIKTTDEHFSASVDINAVEEYIADLMNYSLMFDKNTKKLYLCKELKSGRMQVNYMIK